MKFKLRDYDFFYGLFLILFFGLSIMIIILGSSTLLSTFASAQEEQTPAYKSWYDFRNKEFTDNLEMTQDKTEEPKPVKTWKIPDYMRENLQREVDDFNKRFEAKVQAYKKELKTRFKEFEDMPDDVILYLEGGFFITRSDFLKLQEQLREKLKQEVKGDDKKTN